MFIRDSCFTVRFSFFFFNVFVAGKWWWWWCRPALRLWYLCLRWRTTPRVLSADDNDDDDDDTSRTTTQNRSSTLDSPSPARWPRNGWSKKNGVCRTMSTLWSQSDGRGTQITMSLERTVKNQEIRQDTKTRNFILMTSNTRYKDISQTTDT